MNQNEITKTTYEAIVDAAKDLKAHLQSIRLPRVEVHYELVGDGKKRERNRVDLDNPIAWKDLDNPTAGKEDEEQQLSLYQAVEIATGHILHYKSEFKADGYSLGELIYSLPLAPGQKKEIVVFNASHYLRGEETQSLSQLEGLEAAITNERSITTQLGGRIRESLQGNSSANTSGISLGFGTGGQGYGGAETYGGSGSAVIGVAGGIANANSNATQDSSRNISQHFSDKLRQSIMQNAHAYRMLNGSVVTAVEEGQRYRVASEVIANHNHCHALTMMYFEVLRHYAVYQRLSSVEECVFVPLLMTNFTQDNIYKWRDVLAQYLLPMHAETYLQSSNSIPGSERQHPLRKAFDANERIKTYYANVDYPRGSYDDEKVEFVRGNMRIRIELKRPRTRFDRMMSFPITKQIDGKALGNAIQEFSKETAAYSVKVAATAGIYSLFRQPPPPPNPMEFEVLAREQIFDAFMSLDANFDSVPPAECIRIKNFKPPAKLQCGTLGTLEANISSAIEFFAENKDDKEQWSLYAEILGYPDPLTMLDAYFAGNLIAEWDTIFYNDIVPRIFEKIISNINLSEIKTDFASETNYSGGERLIQLNFTGITSKKRKELPLQLKLGVNHEKLKKLKITLDVLDMTITYSTAHYNGVLFSGNINNDLLDDNILYIPENADEKRNLRKEDNHLVYRLLEHLNSNLEYYNKVLWYNLDPDRRYMLLDGFDIRIFDDLGMPIKGRRSLASVVKNELITITGNSMVFPVAAGYKVSNSYITEVIDAEGTDEENAKAKDITKVTLLDHYQPLTPIEPYRISVPTRGVFAEAVQGACNACEKIETDRLQDWTKFPNIDEPTAISPVTPPTPTITDWRAAFKDFAPPLINIQNAPNAAEPGAGLAGLSELLGKSGIFKDITGLEGNQQNVIRTYLSNQENAKAFAEMAKEMAMQQHNTQNSGKIMDQITAAKNSGAITQQEAGQLTKDHIQQQIDGGQSKKADIQNAKESTSTPYSKAFVEAASRGQSVTGERVVTEMSAREAVSIGPAAGTNSVLAEVSYPVEPMGQSPDKQNDCWAVVATMMMNWKNQVSASVEDAIAPAGDKYVQIYREDTGLTANDKLGLLDPLGMTAEGASSQPASQYITWLRNFGPLWITTDAAPGIGKFSPHARVLIKISGTGSSDKDTLFTFIDPASGQIESPQNFADFISSFEKMVTDLDKAATLFPQVVHFVDMVPQGTQAVEGRKPAPAQKTGLSALADKNGHPKPFVATVLTESKSWIDAVGKGIADWKDSPSTELKDAIGAALLEAAKTAADEATDDIPFVKAMKVAVKYSLVFADGIGEGIDRASQQLSAKYDRATKADPGSNGYSQDDYDALLFARRWQLNSVNELSRIVLTGVNAVLDEAINEFASWAKDEVFKKLKGVSQSLVGHLLEKSPLKAVVYGALDAGSKGISNERQEIYRAALSMSFSLFVRQLSTSSPQQALLMNYTKLGGTDPMGKALLKATASCLVDTATSDPDVKKFIADMKKETRAWIVEHLQNLKQSLAPGVTVVAGDLDVVGDEVRIPNRLLQEINLGTAAFDDQEFQKAMDLTMVLEAVRQATESRLTLLARVHQPKFVYLDELDDTAYQAAFDLYWNEVRDQCRKLTQVYQAAGADPNSSVISVAKISFQTPNRNLPKQWLIQPYRILPAFFFTQEPYRGR